MVTTPKRRLEQIQRSLHTLSEPIGKLTLGNIEYSIPSSECPSRLPHLRASDLLDLHDAFNQDNLHFLLQKYLLGQDVFLVSQPGPYARRLALSFCSLINSEYEYVALHRDIGETELKQGREIREGGTLVYIDSAAVRAVKHGRILILDGIEKAERGIMPLLNNLLENRELNLDDGTHILHPAKYALLSDDDIKSAKFIPAHANFRVIAIAAPVPPFPGHPLDPPFRSRFQARFIDPVGSMLALEPSATVGRLDQRQAKDALDVSDSAFVDKLRSIILTTQYASETRSALEAVARTSSALPEFPQTALVRLRLLAEAFPVSDNSGQSKAALQPSQLARLVLTLHPALLSAPFRAWAALSNQTEDAGLGPLGSPSDFGVASEPEAAKPPFTKGNAAVVEDNIHQYDATGLMGYAAVRIQRVDKEGADVTFARGERTVTLRVAAGPNPFLPFPLPPSLGLDAIWGSASVSSSRSTEPQTTTLLTSPRFLSHLTSLLQAHALGFDIALLPPVLPFSASCSTSLLVRVFASVLGYAGIRDDVHLYKEIGGRELLMRREIVDEGDGNFAGGATRWVPSPLVQGAWNGGLIHLSGIDVIGATAGSISRLLQDREVELWEGKRVVAQLTEPENDKSEATSDGLSTAHPSFRVISTSSKSSPLRDWLTVEHANMLFPVLTQPMDGMEETAVLAQTGGPLETVKFLVRFAQKYRESMLLSVTSKSGVGASPSSGADALQRNRRLGTRALERIARRLKKVPWDDDLYLMITRTVLAEFLPPVERMALESLLEDAGIRRRTAPYNLPTISANDGLVFPLEPLQSPTAPDGAKAGPVFIPRFDAALDPQGAAAHVPHMDHFFDNSLQTGLMRDMAIDLELLGEHLVLLGNQGVGKNKIIDRLCQLLGRPREYVQLHRDTTVSQLMYTTTLERGVLKHTDSPLLRAIKFGRVIVVDEADKAPAHVVAIFRSLGGHGEMTLSDGRRVRPRGQSYNENDILVHPNFRLILLANRPGYPFLGNHFLQVLGDYFSFHSVANPDMASERQLLKQLAPEVDEDTLRRLVAAFQDLRRGYESGKLTYPYSLRELINLVRHMKTYPDDALEDSLRNIFDFDIYKPETIDTLQDILEHHGLNVERLGLDAARGSSKTKAKEVKIEPKGKQNLQGPKKGRDDPNNEEHSGGNTWAGGTGGRDTAGLGGRGGYMRLYKGHEIKQIPDQLKREVPEHIKEKAREMAQQELARKLEELDMSLGEAKEYADLLNEVQLHIAQLHDLLENLSAREEERVWIKRQSDGELDDSRLTEGLTGETTVYKRRGTEKPELGRPQMKPKRIRFVFDISGSMYRFQYDGRLQRTFETAVMLMETFDRLTRKDKYVWDMYGHSGDSPTIPLVECGNPPTEVRDRWKVIQKMNLMTQYAFAGDYTLEAIEKAVDDVAKFDADDWFVIAVSDANFGRYGITAHDLRRVMDRNPKVRTALICIGEGAEALWIPKQFLGRAFRVADTHDIPKVLRSILSSMVNN